MYNFALLINIYSSFLQNLTKILIESRMLQVKQKSF
jgi:hypothetical protein